ncbi:MAG: hypothetical protein ACJ75R_10980 [Solirubrobacterales bacterium]
MAQASTKSRRSSASGGKKRSSSRSSANGGGPSSSSTRSTGKTRTRTKSNSSATATRARKRTSNAKSQATQAPTEAAREAAVEGTKAAGRAVGAAVSKAKTPLIVGGAAVAGVVGGAALRDRLAKNRSNGLVGKLKGISMPSGPAKPDLQGMIKKIDFDKVSSAAERVGTYGRQVDEVAGAVKRASESAKKAK